MELNNVRLICESYEFADNSGKIIKGNNYYVVVVYGKLTSKIKLNKLTPTEKDLLELCINNDIINTDTKK